MSCFILKFVSLLPWFSIKKNHYHFSLYQINKCYIKNIHPKLFIIYISFQLYIYTLWHTNVLVIFNNDKILICLLKTNSISDASHCHNPIWVPNFFLWAQNYNIDFKNYHPFLLQCKNHILCNILNFVFHN